MTTLAIDTEDLRIFMGVDEINTERAQLILDQITLLAQAIVNPVPAEASPVILSASARSYSSPPGSATSELVGPYQATRPSAGLYLTKSERSSLRSLSGGGGAFSYILLPDGYPDSAFTE